MTVAYVSAKPNKYMQLLQIRNRIFNVIDADGYYKKQNPHVTLVPPFKIKNKSKQSIKDICDYVDLTNSSIQTKGLGVHVTPDEPYAIYLNAELENNYEVDNLVQRLQDLSSVPITERADTHISLIKTKGWWDEVPDHVTQRINNEIVSQPDINNLRIAETKVTFKR